VDLGYDPPQGTLLLPVGGPFSAALESSVAWPAGMVIDLYFEGEGSPVTWTATILGTRASWAKTIAEVAVILSSQRRTVALRGTPSGGEPSPWYRLTVRPV
jgi:hypothetical protein